MNTNLSKIDLWFSTIQETKSILHPFWRIFKHEMKRDSLTARNYPSTVFCKCFKARSYTLYNNIRGKNQECNILGFPSYIKGFLYKQETHVMRFRYSLKNVLVYITTHAFKQWNVKTLRKVKKIWAFTWKKKKIYEHSQPNRMYKKFWK